MTRRSLRPRSTLSHCRSLTTCRGLKNFSCRRRSLRKLSRMAVGTARTAHRIRAAHRRRTMSHHNGATGRVVLHFDAPGSWAAEFEQGHTVNYRGSKRKVTQRCDKKRQLKDQGVAALFFQITQGYAGETCVSKTAHSKPRNGTTTQASSGRLGRAGCRALRRHSLRRGVLPWQPARRSSGRSEGLN